MRILYAVTSAGFGGAPLHVLQLIEHMVKQGQEVGLVSVPRAKVDTEGKVPGYSNLSQSSFRSSHLSLEGYAGKFCLCSKISHSPKDLLTLLEAVKDLQERVWLLRERGDASTILAALDTFVLSSRWGSTLYDYRGNDGRAFGDGN